jgi:hypothetical protein
MLRACSRTLDFASSIEELEDAADVDFARANDAWADFVVLTMRILGPESDMAGDAMSVGVNRVHEETKYARAEG